MEAREQLGMSKERVSGSSATPDEAHGAGRALRSGISVPHTQLATPQTCTRTLGAGGSSAMCELAPDPDLAAPRRSPRAVPAALPFAPALWCGPSVFPNALAGAL